MKKTSKVLAPFLALSLALGVPATAAMADSATPTVSIVTEQVCGGLDSGKVDTSGDPATVTVDAPEGMLISGYCVKAGSAKQGDGPEYVTLKEPVKSLTIKHSSGKAVSHYSLSYVKVPVVVPTEPTVEPTTPAPTPTETPTSEPTTPAPTETPDVEPTTPAPEPTTPAPTETPTSPAPTPTPPVVDEGCPVVAVGQFSNNSGLPAELLVTVNGVATDFGLTSVDGAVLSNPFPVNEDDFTYPGLVHLYDVKPGDVVVMTLSNERTSTSGTSVIEEDCYAGINIDLEKFVGPVLPPVEPEPEPVEPVKPIGPVVPVEPQPVKVVTPVEVVVFPNKVSPVVPVTPVSQPAGRTVDTDGALPYTGTSVETALGIGTTMVILGFFMLLSSRLRRTS